MKNRLNNYDLLRIFCILGVILIHVSSTYLKASVNFINTNAENFNHPLANSIYNCIGRFSTPIFLMLTGALVLKSNKNSNCKTFYKKSIRKIFIPVFFFSIFYVIYQLKVYKITNPNDIHTILKLAIQGKPFYHMWYMFMLIPIYIYIPLLLTFKNCVGEKFFKKISIIYLPIAVFFLWYTKPILQYDFGRGFLYLSYVMIGYVIRNNQKHNKTYTYVFIILGIIFELISAFLVYKMTLKGIITDDLPHSIQGITSPLSVIASICIFIGFTNINITQNFSVISNLSYYVYLIHAGVLDIIFKNFPKLVNYNSIIMIPLLTIIVYFISLILSMILNKIYKNKPKQKSYFNVKY